MNYFPYFRGKQYELICIRENAELIAANGFVPIIEPVKEGGGTLKRALKALQSNETPFLVVANPSVGSHAEALSTEIREIAQESLNATPGSAWLYQVKNEQDLDPCLRWVTAHPATAIFHDGLSSGATFSAALGANGTTPSHHIFTTACSKSYRKHFAGASKVLISKGFERRNNRDYPASELFSDLNVTYADEGMTGFGDYLIVGSDYSETGGPAYAIAIHVTYLDPENDGAIYVYHFVSDRVDSPTDPAGKFREALAKLVQAANRSGTKIAQTAAIEEFRKLSSMQHFPGLGYVKKLCMQHHLELLASE